MVPAVAALVRRGCCQMRLTQRFPWLYNARVAQLRLARRLSDAVGHHRFAARQSAELLPVACYRHGSLLRRILGDSDPILQENKIVNLSIAGPRIDGILIGPGETFSYWRLVGKTSASKGYREGLVLSQDRVSAGVGGGLCQLANLLYWMALHTPLEVVERHHHGFDPFPDYKRVLPFGTGASVFYNYLDLRFHNPTDVTFQLRVWLTDEYLRGEVRADRPLPVAYHIKERNHRYLRRDGVNYRENEIWRRTIDVRTGETASLEMLMHNFSEVRYELPAGALADAPSVAGGVGAQ